MQAFPRHVAVALLLVSLLPGTGRADAPPDLVVVGEPTASEALADPAARGPVTLAYRVVEIFAGEPEGASLVVRHASLSAEERARLRDGERVILLARRDPETPGRYTATSPLRATPSAVAAFRKWSAPEDVRAARPVESVVAEVSSGRAPDPAPEPDPPAARAPAPAPAPEAPADAATPAVVARFEPPPARPAVEEETLAPRAEVAARHVEIAAPPASVARPAPIPPAVRPAPAPASHEPAWDPPLLIDPALQPAPGPGLPPSPSVEPLGPEPSSRSDLRPPPRGRRR